MRCPQCGTDAAQGAQFCSRCGARLFQPRPEAVREFMLTRAHPSLWYYSNLFLLGAILIAAGARVLYISHQMWQIGFALLGAGAALIILPAVLVRSVTWSVTSDRVIEQRGMLSSRRREMELGDIRSIEVDKRVLQRMFGLGNVTIASAASADFTIRLHDIAGPDSFAETVRKARLKRLA
ncbi:MAG TPA: PH domain-containing protein [Candidatus Binataceae bacterium]|nr:PH domain-containing protein [Candidatus Binataceae bacterium]